MKAVILLSGGLDSTIAAELMHREGLEGLVVGRNESEDERLERLAQAGDYFFQPLDVNGPTAIGRGLFNPDLIYLSCKIVVRYYYSDGLHSIGMRQCPEVSKKRDRRL